MAIKNVASSNDQDLLPYGVKTGSWLVLFTIFPFERKLGVSMFVEQTILSKVIDYGQLPLPVNDKDYYY